MLVTKALNVFCAYVLFGAEIVTMAAFAVVVWRAGVVLGIALLILAGVALFAWALDHDECHT